MFNDLSFAIKNKMKYEKEIKSYPLSRVTITKFRDPTKSQIVSFPSFESPHSTKNRNSNRQSTLQFMKNYVDQIKKQRKIQKQRFQSRESQKEADSVGGLKGKSSSKRYVLKIPELCQGQKINLKGIEAGYSFEKNGLVHSLKRETPDFDLEAEKEKEKIAELLKKIRISKEKVHQTLSPRSPKKEFYQTLKKRKQKKKKEEINPFNEKNLDPWKEEKKPNDFSIEDYKKNW